MKIITRKNQEKALVKLAVLWSTYKALTEQLPEDKYLELGLMDDVTAIVYDLAEIVAELNGSMELRSMTRELSELINTERKEVTPMYPIIIKADTHTTYHEIDGIRLVFEDGVSRGWYNPNKDNDE